MSDDLAPAIALFERIIADAERKVAEARGAINALLQARGLPPRYGNEGRSGGDGGIVLSGSGVLSGGGSLSGNATQIRRDTFYGKKQMTAIRELLEMRRAGGEGPATPKEVVTALKAGGYKFEAKSDEIALIGVRALMRKATTVFHKLPGTNAYGLAAWYPNARATAETPAKSAKRPKVRPSKRATVAKPKSVARPKRGSVPPANSAISTFVENALADGSEWTTERLLREAVSRGIEGITESTSKQKFQGALLALQRRKRALPQGGGVWKIALLSETSPSADPQIIPIKKGVA
jgi:hypothetical protein